VPLSLLTGLILPYETMAFLAIYIFGRYYYTQGYLEKEGALNKKRMIGSMLVNITHIGILGLTMLIGIKMSRGR
jgi:hypothetical protein